MRVAFDASIQRDAPTGVERAQADALAALLAHADLEVLVFCDRPLPGALARRLERAGGERLVVRCGDGRAPARLWRQALLPRWAARAGAELLHAPGAAFPLALRGPLVATLHELPWLDGPAEGDPAGDPAGDRRLRHRLWARLAARRARRIVVPSARTRGQVARLDPRAADRTRIVPWCVDAGGFATTPSTPRPPEGPYLLCVGVLRRKKNLALVVEALARLRERGGALRLVLAGDDGNAAAALRSLVCARGLDGAVTFLGRVDDATLGALYRGALALVHPARLEGYGLVPLEAMALGCPVVASAQGAVPEVVGDGAALVFDGTSADALAGALTRVMHDEALRARLVAAGRARAAARTPARLAAALAAVYAECAGAPRAPAGARSR